MRDRRLLALAALAAVGLAAVLAYLPALGNGLAFDDRLLTEAHDVVAGERWADALVTPYHHGPLQPRPTGAYRPLTILSLIADRALGEGDVRLHHAVNVVLHALVSVLVLALGFRLALPPPAALLGGLAFALHPVHAEAVASVAGRADLLASLLALAALHALALARPAARASLFGLCLLLSLLAKETALLWPALALGWEAGARASDRRRALALTVGAGGLAVLVYLVARNAVLGGLVGEGTRGGLLENPLGTLPVVPRLVGAAVVAARALGLLVFPRALSPDYGWAETGLPPSATTLLGAAAALAAATTLGLLVARRSRRGAFLVALVLAPWLLVSNTVIVIGTAFGERLLYLPSAGFCLLLGWGAASVRGRSLRWVALAAAALLLLLGAARTWRAGAAWRNDATLFRAALAATPRSVKVLGNLAVEEAGAGRPAEAAALLDRALALAPDAVPLRLNRASLCLALGELDEAERHLAHVRRLQPDEPVALLLQASIAEGRGNLEEAERLLARAAEVRPGWEEPARALARLRARHGLSEPGTPLRERRGRPG
jgi:tetratricopeptide (TPR) repeat protein